MIEARGSFGIGARGAVYQWDGPNDFTKGLRGVCNESLDLELARTNQIRGFAGFHSHRGIACTRKDAPQEVADERIFDDDNQARILLWDHFYTQNFSDRGPAGYF